MISYTHIDQMNEMMTFNLKFLKLPTFLYKNLG